MVRIWHCVRKKPHVLTKEQDFSHSLSQMRFTLVRISPEDRVPVFKLRLSATAKLRLENACETSITSIAQ